MTKNPENPKILVADDQIDVLESLRLLLKTEGYRIDTAASPPEILKLVEKNDYSLLVMDLNYSRDTTSGQEGMELLPRVQKLDNTLPVVVMTAWGSVELAVEAMRLGARDFIQKPWDNERLMTIVRTQVELGEALRKGRRLEAENRLLRSEGRPLLIAESESMRPVLDLIARVGPSDANVLILGENGTGKNVVAQMLHASSERSGRPLVTVNLGGLSEGVLESEMFGHVKGAFTDAKSDRVGRFEMAEGGTLFLDEIANLPLSQQPKLLRVLETGEYERVGSSKSRKSNVRVLSATNADIQKEVEEGRFRQDLLFRLNTVEIRIPPLRDRLADIPLLAQHFLQEQGRHYRKKVIGFNPEAAQALKEYHWPGNVRELSHTVERAVLMSQGEMIKKGDLALEQSSGTSRRLEDMSLEEVEQFLIKKALDRYNNNVSTAARKLGLSRSGLYRRLKRYGL